MELSKELLNNIIDITSNSAIATYQYIGKNNKILADKAATDVMRDQLNKLNIEDRSKFHLKLLYIFHLILSYFL